MTAGSAALDDPRPGSRVPRRLARILGEAALLAVVSVLLGALTSFAQALLPDVLRPLANSASGWTLPTALLVWALRDRARVSAVLGAIGFECLVLGYVLASTLRGFPDSETLFLLIGLVGGPIVGAAASWLHVDGWRPAVGAGVLAGVLVGEATWGLAVVAATTGWAFWAGIGALGPVLLAAVAVRRRFARGQALLAVGATLATAAAFLAVYTVLS